MKIPLQQRLEIGHRILGGERVSVLAREFGLARDTITQCATEFLYCLQDFDSFEFRRILRNSRLGQLQASVVLYTRICERAAPATPALVWHCGLRLATTRSLLSAGFGSREEVLKAYRDGSLQWAGQKLRSSGKPGIGASRLTEIALWLGEAPPSRARNQVQAPGASAGTADEFKLRRLRGGATPAM